MKKINYYLEQFVEKYNGVIQLLLLAIVTGISCFIAAPELSQNEEIGFLPLFKISITLIIGIISELILLQIKDSSTQRKINGIGEIVRGLPKREDMWREETDLESFFNAAEDVFFISGIVIDKLIMKYLYRIKELLDRGVKVRILIESLEELEEAAKFLYGKDYNRETSLHLIRSRLDNTLIYLQSLEGFEDYFSNKRLRIGLSKTPLVNPSIIAYDYKKGNTFEARRTELSTAPEMSVRFYIQGVDGPTSKLRTHPTLVINSNIMAKQYDDFVQLIENAWSSSTHIKTKEDLSCLRHELTQCLKNDNV